MLGCYLFNVGVDDLEEDVPCPASQPRVWEHLTRKDDFPATSTPSRVGHNFNDLGLSPMGAAPKGDFTILPRIANIPTWLKKRTEKAWTEKYILKLKYVDDEVNAEVINMKEVPMLIMGESNFKETNAPGTSALL